MNKRCEIQQVLLSKMITRSTDIMNRHLPLLRPSFFLSNGALGDSVSDGISIFISGDSDSEDSEASLLPGFMPVADS